MKITKKNLLRKIQILLLCKLLTFFSWGALACISKPDQIIVPGSSFSNYKITVEQSNKQHVITWPKWGNSKVKYNYTQNCWYFIKSKTCFMEHEDLKDGKFILTIGKAPRRFGYVYFQKLTAGSLPQLKIYSVNSNGKEDKSLPYLILKENAIRDRSSWGGVISSTLTAEAFLDNKLLGTYISKAKGRSSDGVQARGGFGSATNTNTNTQQTTNQQTTNEVKLTQNQTLVNQTGCGAIKQ